MNEITYTSEQLQNAYYKLPQLVRQAINKADALSTILTLEKKFNLHIDQIGALGDAINLVLFGLAPPENFVSHIQRKLFLTSEQAREVAATVNTQIFSKVQELVKARNAAIQEAMDDFKAALEQARSDLKAALATPTPTATP